MEPTCRWLITNELQEYSRTPVIISRGFLWRDLDRRKKKGTPVTFCQSAPARSSWTSQVRISFRPRFSYAQPLPARFPTALISNLHQNLRMVAIQR